MISLLVLFFAFILCGAKPQEGPPGPPGPPGPHSLSGPRIPYDGPRSHPPPGPPNFPREPPPEFKDVLPKSTWTELNAIHHDISLNKQQRKAHLRRVMNKLPAELVQKLPLPNGFERLPEDVQNKMKAIQSDTSLDWDVRMENIRSYIDTLPNDQKILIEPLPERFQRYDQSPSGFMPNEYENMTGEIRAKLEAAGLLTTKKP